MRHPKPVQEQAAILSQQAHSSSSSAGIPKALARVWQVTTSVCKLLLITSGLRFRWLSDSRRRRSTTAPLVAELEVRSADGARGQALAERGEGLVWVDAAGRTVVEVAVTDVQRDEVGA